MKHLIIFLKMFELWIYVLHQLQVQNCFEEHVNHVYYGKQTFCIRYLLGPIAVNDVLDWLCNIIL